MSFIKTITVNGVPIEMVSPDGKQWTKRGLSAVPCGVATMPHETVIPPKFLPQPNAVGSSVDVPDWTSTDSSGKPTEFIEKVVQPVRYPRMVLSHAIAKVEPHTLEGQFGVRTRETLGTQGLGFAIQKSGGHRKIVRKSQYGLSTKKKFKALDNAKALRNYYQALRIAGTSSGIFTKYGRDIALDVLSELKKTCEYWNDELNPDYVRYKDVK